MIRPGFPSHRALLKARARRAMSGRIIRTFLAWMCAMGLPWLLQLFPSNLGIVYVDVSGLYVGFSIPMSVLSLAVALFAVNPMSVKLAEIYLSMLRNRDFRPAPLKVTECFGPGYARLFFAMLKVRVRVYAPAVVPFLLYLLLPGVLSSAPVDDIVVWQVAGLPYIVMVLSFILLYQETVYLYMPYLLAAHPTEPIAELLREARQLTQKHIWSLIFMRISFIGWIFLTGLTMGIAGIYAYPYMEMTVAAYYLDATGVYEPTLPPEPDAII